jgi:site-specific DNA recombinase
MDKHQTAVVYARVSTAKQADDGLPIEGQIELAHRKAQELGATVVREFVDAGISGRTDERPSFQDAVSYCKATGVDYFICWSTSRFARNKLDAALYKRELEDVGTRVVYVSVDLDNRTDSGWMMESILEIFDEHYSRQVSADTLRSMIKNARDGFYNGGRAPFGYDIVQQGKRKKLLVNETDAFVVRHIFREFIGGTGCASIAMALNEQQLLRRGERWSKNTVSLLLKNEVYTGHILFNRFNRVTGKRRPRSEWIVTPSHVAIIDEDDFMKVQKLFETRTAQQAQGSPKSTFVFTGMAKCGVCGSGLRIESGTGRDRVYHYYRCFSSQFKKGCNARRIPAQELDAFLMNAIMDHILTPQVLREGIEDLHDLAGQWVKDRADRRATIVKGMRSTETKLRNIYEILELHGKDAPNLADLSIRIRELRKQRDEAEQQLIRLEEEQAPEIMVDDRQIDEFAQLMREIILTTENEKKLRAFFSTFIERIVVSAREALIEYRVESILNRAAEGTVHSSVIWLPVHDLSRTKFIRLMLPNRCMLRAA